MKQRIYVDTSVIGGCLDDEFSRWSVQLFEEFRRGLRIAVISDLTRREIEGAPENVKEILLSLPETTVENVFLTEEAEELALRYVDDGVVSLRHITYSDCISRESGFARELELPTDRECRSHPLFQLS